MHEKKSFKTLCLELLASKTFLVCCSLTLLYLISGYCKWIEIAVAVVAVIFMATLSLQEALCIFMFLHCFTLSNIFLSFTLYIALVAFSVILLVKYCIGVKTGKYRIKKNLLIVLAAFTFFFTIVSIPHNIFLDGFTFLLYIPILYFVCTMRSEFDINQGMNFMLFGLVLSSTLAVVGLLLPHFQYSVFREGRFMAFISNPNYLYIRALFILSYYMYAYLNKGISNLKFLVTYAFCVVITLLTLSKTGIAMLALITLIFIALFLKQDFKKNIKIVGMFALVVLIVGAVGFKLIFSIVERFSKDLLNENIISSLLTGRDDIWRAYLKEIFNNPFTALFGKGFLAMNAYVPEQMTSRNGHSLYIWLLYRFGIIGCITIGIIIFWLIKNAKSNKPASIAYLPLIFILVESLVENTFMVYNFTCFVFALMVLFANCKQKSLEENKNPQMNEQF